MDDIVISAMARWPNVPAVYGWLKLDRRGRWWIKDDLVTNPVIHAFINRNYLCDNAGRWYFQNGPQRVLVTLEYTPYVYRLWQSAGDLVAETHTGLPVNGLFHCWLDDAGAALIETEHGIGCVESQSLDAFVQALGDSAGNRLDEEAIDALLGWDERQAARSRLRWRGTLVPLGLIRARDVPGRFGFDPSPQPRPGEAPC